MAQSGEEGKVPMTSSSKSLLVGMSVEKKAALLKELLMSEAEAGKKEKSAIEEDVVCQHRIAALASSIHTMCYMQSPESLHSCVHKPTLACMLLLHVCSGLSIQQ